MLDRFSVLAEGLHHPEGVTWDPVGERVIAGGEGGELYGVSLDGDVDLLSNSGGSMLGVAVDGTGRIGTRTSPGRRDSTTSSDPPSAVKQRPFG